MQVLVFGNEQYAPDSLPVKILPELRKTMPDVEFIWADPNEEWPDLAEMTVIDTGINLTRPTEFDSLDEFVDAPRLSMHDFDALTQLRLLKKIGRIKKVRILALPPEISHAEAVDWLSSRLDIEHS